MLLRVGRIIHHGKVNDLFGGDVPQQNATGQVLDLGCESTKLAIMTKAGMRVAAQIVGRNETDDLARRIAVMLVERHRGILATVLVGGVGDQQSWSTYSQ